MNTFYLGSGKAQTEWLSTPQSVAEFRAQVESFKPATTAFELFSVKDISVELTNRSVPIRIYNPSETGPKPVLIYVHGACWVAGSLESHDEVSRYLAKQSDSIVIAIDYRLAPEFKYPAGHNDVYDSVKWIWDNAEALNIDKAKFAIGGESAGAYYAAATTLRTMKEPNAPKIAFQLLVFAALDGGGSSWTECKDQYFEKPEDVRTDYGSPLWAQDFTGMPPTFNVFGQFEQSRAEQELFMRKLAEQGVSTHSFMVENVEHDVVNWLRVSGELAAHKKAIEYINLGFHRD
jgi:acetyl esterase